MTYSTDMKSRIHRLYCFVALAGTLSAPLAEAAEDRSWVERSDRVSAIVFESLGPFQPEQASALGLERFDTAALDLKPGRTARHEAAARRVLQRLAALRNSETDPRVRQDLDLLIDAVERQRRTRALEHRLLIPYFDLPKHVFEGLQMLLDARNGESRHRNALQRMRIYAGLEHGVAPFAELAFAEVREEISRLAAQIARERKLDSGDYRQVLRELKRQQVPPERIVALYRERLKQIEDIIVRERIITLPQRGASIRLASEAESAAIPAPYMNPPRLLGNKGELGEFVLPLGNPNAKSSDPADDFTAEATAWTMTAHEARPGHELQFAAMVERGVSIARAAFAFNSTNAEGWALYAEAIMTPHFPLDGQLFALQLRLQRAARAFLDPMVNLGTMTPAAAKEFLMSEVVLSEPMAQQEADRYAFVWPGQAVSYLYGYARLRELRLKAEVALGPRFDQRQFHDLVIAQGLLPPGLLERAVLAELTRRFPGPSRTRALPDFGGSRSPRDAQGR